MQGAAVAAAVDQARLRKGVNQVFLNISMRNQSLLHRQLRMLDSMERRTSDPAALADLFRLDHLTTRMRRHAEGLIILSGSTPAAAGATRCPVVDVLRAAVAEVEDYVRVDVISESRDLVAGSAVNDVIHLIAELVENATVFSPPNTRIEVRADRVGTGLVAEIEDRGLGLSHGGTRRHQPAPGQPAGVRPRQQRPARPVRRQPGWPPGTASRSSLRQSAYGGTTAILLLPFGVIVREEEAATARRPGRLARRWPRGDRPCGAVRPRLGAVAARRTGRAAVRRPRRAGGRHRRPAGRGLGRAAPRRRRPVATGAVGDPPRRTEPQGTGGRRARDRPRRDAGRG